MDFDYGNNCENSAKMPHINIEEEEIKRIIIDAKAQEENIVKSSSVSNKRKVSSKKEEDKELKRQKVSKKSKEKIEEKPSPAVVASVRILESESALDCNKCVTECKDCEQEASLSCESSDEEKIFKNDKKNKYGSKVSKSKKSPIFKKINEDVVSDIYLKSHISEGPLQIFKIISNVNKTIPVNRVEKFSANIFFILKSMRNIDYKIYDFSPRYSHAKFPVDLFDECVGFNLKIVNCSTSPISIEIGDCVGIVEFRNITGSPININLEK